MLNEANQYSILVIWGEGKCYTVGMWEGGKNDLTLLLNTSN